MQGGHDAKNEDVPSPVPPYLREREVSTWEKGLKRTWKSSALMPMPVSRTSKCSSRWSSLSISASLPSPLADSLPLPFLPRPRFPAPSSCVDDPSSSRLLPPVNVLESSMSELDRSWSSLLPPLPWSLPLMGPSRPPLCARDAG